MRQSSADFAPPRLPRQRQRTAELQDLADHRTAHGKDCQWGATLHAHGLLRAGFVPPADIRRFQDYLRLLADHILSASASVQHMQKALERMNVKLHDVISSLVGAGGLKVIEAILAGEREPERLLALCDAQIQKKKAERVKESLHGTWAEEHLFALRQAVENWQHYQKQIAACDRKIEAVLRAISGPDQPVTDVWGHISTFNILTFALPGYPESAVQVLGNQGSDFHAKWWPEGPGDSWIRRLIAQRKRGRSRLRPLC